jgi:hypothetical protein
MFLALMSPNFSNTLMCPAGAHKSEREYMIFYFVTYQTDTILGA